MKTPTPSGKSMYASGFQTARNDSCSTIEMSKTAAILSCDILHCRFAIANCRLAAGVGNGFSSNGASRPGTNRQSAIGNRQSLYLDLSALGELWGVERCGGWYKSTAT